MDIAEGDAQYFSLCTFYDLEDKDIKSKLNDLLSVRIAKELPNRSAEVNVDKNKLRLIYSDGQPEPPEPDDFSRDVIRIELSENGPHNEDSLHVHLYGNFDSREYLLSILSDVIDVLGGVDVRHLDVAFLSNTTFSDLDLDSVLPSLIDGDGSIISSGVETADGSRFHYSDYANGIYVMYSKSFKDLSMNSNNVQRVFRTETSKPLDLLPDTNQ